MGRVPATCLAAASRDLAGRSGVAVKASSGMEVPPPTWRVGVEVERSRDQLAAASHAVEWNGREPGTSTSSS